MTFGEWLITKPAFWLLLICGIALTVWSIRNPSGADRSRDFNNRRGKYRVQYHDGYSERMCKDVAHEYASIFGGKVITDKEYQFRKEQQ